MLCCVLLITLIYCIWEVVCDLTFSSGLFESIITSLSLKGGWGRGYGFGRT